LAFCACPTGEAFYPTLLEALAYSLPIVLPKQLCFELMAQGGGLFYHPDRPTKIPKLLANLSEKNGGKAKAAKWKARQTAETRSWQRFGERIWKVYQL
jgi:glycosyltransferase involved in cell wall biosynthesis